MATVSLQAVYDQARSLLEENKFDQAIAVVHHVLDYFPQSLEAYRILGEAYLASRHFDQAQVAFSRVLHADPENIPAHVGLGITYERQNKLEQAVGEFEQALEIRPDMQELRGQLLRLYTDLWGSEKASLRLSSPGLARLYAKGHMFPQAIQEFRSVIDKSPERFDARVGLAEVLWRDGQERVAAEECETILGQRADVLKANLLLGYIRLAAGDERGLGYWQTAQQLEPYQVVARALFEPMPDTAELPAELPAWDEAAWVERQQQAEQAAQQQAQAEQERLEAAQRRERDEQQRREQEAQVALATPAVGSADDDFFNSSWMDEIDQPAAQSAAPVSRSTEAEDDDFLASLLAFEGLSNDELSAATGETLSMSNDAVAQQPDVDDDPMMVDDASVDPFAFDDFASESDVVVPEVQSLSQQEDAKNTLDQTADVSTSHEEQSATDESLSLEDEPDLTPFSFGDLGFSDEEIAALEGSQATADTPDVQRLDDAAATDEPALTPFSLGDLGLSDEEIAALGDTPADAMGEQMSEQSDEPDLTPFSFSDLGLSDEEIAALDSIDEPQTAAREPSAAIDADPFDLSQAQAESPTSQTAGNVDDGDDSLDDLQPFSLDDLDLNFSEDDDYDTDLPSSLRRFSLDEAGSPPLPSISAEGDTSSFEGDETSDEPGGYSWQQPAAKSNTDFLRNQREGGGDLSSSIFSKLKQRHQDLPAGEQEELTEATGAENDASLGFFSNDEISLRDDADQNAGASPRFTGAFRLPKEADLAADAERMQAETTDNVEVPAAEGSDTSAAKPGAEPVLTPFSLSDLGLSDEEIAAFESANAADEASAASMDTTGSSTDQTTSFDIEDDAFSDTTDDELALTPFSLSDLGLSDEEIAALGTGESDDSTTSGTTDDEPALTPFSLSDLGLSDEEIAALGTGESDETSDSANMPTATTPVQDQSLVDDDLGFEPFSFDDLGLESGDESASPITPEQPSSAGASDDSFDDLQPFSFDDLDLDGGTSDAPRGSDRSELGLSFDEVNSLDLGNLEPTPQSTIGRTQLPAEDSPTVDTGDQALDTLITLGQRQGYIDITDIISVVSDPEEEAERIEEIGWTLHRAGIEIRDGDEVIDMEAEEVDAPDDTPEPFEAAIEDGSEPDLTPFSLTDLGLSEEEIAALGLAEAETDVSAVTSDLAAEIDTSAPTNDLAAESDQFIATEQPIEVEQDNILESLSGDDEPELTPFSLADLGLSPEEIAALELAEAEATTTDAAPEQATNDIASDFATAAEQPVDVEQTALPQSPASQADGGSAEPELTPFSLADLGLSEEEIAALELEQANALTDSQSSSGTAPTATTDTPAPEADDMFDFSVVDEQPAETVARAERTAPRTEEPVTPVSPEDAAFTPEPLDDLDDVWDVAEEPAAEPTQAQPTSESSDPARVVLPPLSERQDRLTRTDIRRRPERSERAERPARAEQSRSESRSSRRSEQRQAPDEQRTASRRTESTPRKARPTFAQAVAEFLPTGDEALDSYLQQLSAEPDNYGLSLAVGRLGAQTGRADLMALQYKRLVRENQLLDQVVEEVEELVEDIDDVPVLRQLYRVLGDAYSKQGRFRDAVDAYGHTFAS